jgi:hypothetical protein
MRRDLTGGFTPDQMRRYARHVLLPDLGGRGQARLLAATLAVPVDGAAGRIAAAYLAAAGVGTILVAGDPTRPVTSAHFPFTRPDLGQPASALLARLANLNPDAHISWYQPSDTRPGGAAMSEDRTGDTRFVSEDRMADTRFVAIEGDADHLPLAEAMARGGEVAARWVWRLAVAP